MDKVLYYKLYYENNIKHPIKDVTKIYSLSDLQIPQRNLLEYEPIPRIEKANLIYKNKILTKEIYSNLSNEDKDKYTIESSFYIINQYKKKIIENIDNFNTFIDLWDFIFNITNIKIDILIKTWLFIKLKEIFDFLKEHGVYRVLVLWNHDNIKYKDFYYIFFDKILEYWTTYNNWILELYTHIPFLKKEYNYKTKIEYNINKDIYQWLSNLIENGTIISSNIINIHWHLHSSKIHNDKSKFYGMSYINRCIDYLLVNNIE